jgi:hypothetical protein
MSKLAKLIDATITGDKKLVQNLKPQYTDVKLETGNVTREMGIAKAVKIGVTFQQVVYIDQYELDQSNGEALEHALVSIKRSIVEEVFGEFRSMLRDIHSATYDADMTRVRNATTALEQAMFYDGI